MLGYCTNVHRGDTFQDVLENIRTVCKPVCTSSSIQVGAGLWLSNQASINVDVVQLQDTLHECGVLVNTLNGFPYSNFHADIVKHNVYEPTWAEPERLEYTLRLANILAEIVEGNDASISTLPLGWDNDSFHTKDAADMLKKCADQLDALEQRTGVCVHVDLEAEPGCRLQRSHDVADFMNTYFDDDARARRYIRVCHDTCHGAVMHEHIEDMLTNYSNAGLLIGKVQVSSAIEVDFNTANTTDCIQDLKAIAEPRYLHQTTILNNQELLFYENLSDVPLENPSGVWRVHFHVPIHQKTVGSLGTTQSDLIYSIPALVQFGVTNWEVETYTWSVMPSTMRVGDIVESISKELEWAASQIYT